jgi:hypothetical protein
MDTQVASTTKKEERTTIQAGYNAVSRGATSPMCADFSFDKNFVVTLMEFNWYSGDIDCWDEGFHPGRTMYSSAAHAANNQRLLLTYQALVEDRTMTMHDMATFQLLDP